MDTGTSAATDSSAGTDAPVEPNLLRRRERLRSGLDVTAGRGLEIGPLSAPLVPRADADVWYADVLSTEGLREHYRTDPMVPADQIVEVDVSLYEAGRLRSISEATEGIGPFDWAVASHVIEHVPDLIGWLQDMADLLVDGGRLALVVPDRRYTFDARRPATSLGEVFTAHESADQRPSIRAVFDHFRDAVTISAHDAWRGVHPGPEARIHDLAFLRGMLDRFRTTDEYIDCHVWVFTPAELVGQLRDLAALGLVDFVVQEVLMTPVDEIEFHLVLRRLPRSATPQERAAAFEDGFRCPPDNVLAETQDPSAPVGTPVPAGHALHPITPREVDLVRVKRRLLGPVRATAARLRRRS
jgi:SAM-dependent methyltransferase